MHVCSCVWKSNHWWSIAMKLWVPRHTYIPTCAPRYFDRIVRVSYWCNMIKRWKQPMMIVGEADGNRRTVKASASANPATGLCSSRWSWTVLWFVPCIWSNQPSGSFIANVLLQSIRRSHRHSIDSPRCVYQDIFANNLFLRTLTTPCENSRVSIREMRERYRSNFSSWSNYIRIHVTLHDKIQRRRLRRFAVQRDWVDSLPVTSLAIPLHTWYVVLSVIV